MRALILALAAASTLAVALPGAALAEPYHHDRWDRGHHDRDRGHGGYRWRGASYGHRAWECHRRFGHRVCAFRYW